MGWYCLSVVMRALYQIAMALSLKKQLSQAKLSIYWFVYSLILTYGHVCWVLTERTRSKIQVAEVRFLWLSDRVRNSDIWRKLGVEPLLLGVK